MTQRRAAFAWVPVALLALGCGSTGRNPDVLDVGSDDGGSVSFGPGLDASSPGALDAHIEQNGIAVTFVTLSCTGPCAEVVAVPTGGDAPYTFEWDDGSTRASRTVCPASSTRYDVKVSDTATSGELGRTAQTVQVPLAASVVACPDAGTDGGSRDAGPPACTATTSSVAGLPETLAMDVTGPVRYFAGGASLPAGKYRVEYVDGCVTYGPGYVSYPTPWGWTIHTGTVSSNIWLSGMPYSGDCVMVGATQTDVIGVLPGTTNPPPGIDTYADCVAANKTMDAPVDFDFAGGALGLFIEDTMAGDNVGGSGSGGVTPTWKLTPLSVCAR